MGVITIREFNANVSKAIARAKAGEVVSITSNGEPVAELRPPRNAEWYAARARLDKLWGERWGVIDGSVSDEDKRGDLTS